MSEQEQALRALQAANFDWTMHIKSVWRDSQFDVDHLHENERRQIIREITRLQAADETNSPLGMVLVGAGGTGKTHLLSAMRKYAFSQQIGFVLIDMTDVKDFEKTVLQGYVSSLQVAEADGIPQFERLLECLLQVSSSPITPPQLAQAPIPMLTQVVQNILAALVRKERQKTIQFQDVIRSLLLLNSTNFDAQSIGDKWLGGCEVDEAEKSAYGFTKTSMDSISIVEGLSWLMSIRGASILALDQLDPVVAQYHQVAKNKPDALSEEQRALQTVANSIIEGISNGLSALRDKTAKTLILVSCLETTWSILQSGALGTVKGRFHEPKILSSVLQTNIAKQIVERRLQEAYRKTEFSPTYPTWPFSDRFFESAVRQLPRAILRRCYEYREQCLENSSIAELDSFSKEPLIPRNLDLEPIDQSFADAKAQIDPAIAKDKQNEDILGTWLKTACECLIHENPVSGDIDALVEVDFPAGKTYPLLHTRIHLVFPDQSEKHLSVRALQQMHHNAYIGRLKAAMTASGIDRSLNFRQLLIVRTQDQPHGKVTQETITAFRSAGGVFGYPEDNELQVLGALHQLLEHQSFSQLDSWLRDRRPVSQLPFMRDIVTWLFEEMPSPKPQTQPGNDGQTVVGNFPIGSRLIGQQPKETVLIRVEDLTKHAVILAGSGSGKTVLVKRIVEEAALMGIPAIVIDGANDLSQMGDRWASPPASWREEDRQKADRYHQNTQVVVWTPGRETANPLNLNPLPDFAAVANEPDELNQAIDMAHDSLQDIVASGKSNPAKVKQGILREAIEYFAQRGGGSLEDFAELLGDLPADAIGSYSNSQKRVQEMADLLNAEISKNPLLKQRGSALDPAILFGLKDASDKTRISILNFIGLPGLGQQQQFLNQLAMTLFTWIKKNPAPDNQPLRGLLVIDEAKDFVPSGSSTSCKASIIRLAAQARKYGLGIIFATQAPKSIDHNIIANCSTQFYGRANSPAAIAVMQEQLSQRGGSGQDIAKLAKGQFYAVSEALATPVKILTPLCLSYHPETPPDEAEVIKRAKSSRNAL
jgi:Helicase HerA, central domain